VRKEVFPQKEHVLEVPRDLRTGTLYILIQQQWRYRVRGRGNPSEALLRAAGI
jgi:hypothetical protein